MPCQFARMELHSRAGCLSAEERERRTGTGKNGTARSKGRRPLHAVFAELARKPDASLHVAHPRPPIVVYDGADPDAYDPDAFSFSTASWYHAVKAIGAAKARHDEIVEGARLLTRNGVRRRLPPQSLTLRGDVYSWHQPVAALEGEHRDQILFRAWLADIVGHVRAEVEELGGTIELVVLHLDEAHPHVHILSTHPDGLIGCLDPGYVAHREAIEAGKTLAVACERRRAAKSAWQDRLHEAVSHRYGMSRFGPRRQRLTSEERYEQSATQAAIAKATEDRLRTERENEEAQKERAALEGKHAALASKLATLRTEADAEVARAEGARADVERAEEKLEAAQNECDSANEARNRSVREESSARRETRKLRKTARSLEIRVEAGKGEVADLTARYRAGRKAAQEAEEAAIAARKSAEDASVEADGILARAKSDAEELQRQTADDRMEAGRLRESARKMEQEAEETRSRLNDREVSVDRREAAVEAMETKLAKRDRVITTTAQTLRTGFEQRLDEVSTLAADLHALMDAIPTPLRSTAEELVIATSKISSRPAPA